MSQTMLAYGFLAIAIVSEVTGATFLAKSEGFSKPLPTITTVICFGIAFYFLSQVIKTIPLGIAYAIWSGVGIVLTAIIGYFILGNKLDLPAIAGMSLIVLGVIVINLFSHSATH
nr:SMR family transporter [Moraxella osloensis]